MVAYEKRGGPLAGSASEASILRRALPRRDPAARWVQPLTTSASSSPSAPSTLPISAGGASVHFAAFVSKSLQCDAAEALELGCRMAPLMIPGVQWAHFLSYSDGDPPILTLVYSGGGKTEPAPFCLPLYEGITGSVARSGVAAMEADASQHLSYSRAHETNLLGRSPVIVLPVGTEPLSRPASSRGADGGAAAAAAAGDGTPPAPPKPRTDTARGGGGPAAKPNALAGVLVLTGRFGMTFGPPELEVARALVELVRSRVAPPHADAAAHAGGVGGSAPNEWGGGGSASASASGGAGSWVEDVGDGPMTPAGHRAFPTPPSTASSFHSLKHAGGAPSSSAAGGGGGGGGASAESLAPGAATPGFGGPPRRKRDARAARGGAPRGQG